jgi:hypothetical protein
MSEHLVPNQGKKTQSKVLPKDGNIVFQKNTQIDQKPTVGPFRSQITAKVDK